MLYNRPFNHNRQFAHWTGGEGRSDRPEARHRERHRLVEGLGLDVNAMSETVAISERYAATGDAHGQDGSALFTVCSPSSSVADEGGHRSAELSLLTPSSPEAGSADG
jgi:hypothetical protein